MRKILYIIILLAGLVTSLFAQDKKVPDTVTSPPGIIIETSVDRAEIYIGDLINYRLTITHDSNIALTPPPIGANLGAFDVKDYKTEDEVKMKNGRIKTESRFLLTTFTTGDYIIPPIPVEYMLPDSARKILISEPVPIKVKSLLAEAADTSDIHPAKDPYEFKSRVSVWYYFVAALFILLIAASVVWFVILRKKEKPSKPVDLRKPWEIAFEQLAFLKEKNYLDSGQFKQFYTELTEILRAFLGRIYGIPVLDMTTYELLAALAELNIEEKLYSRLKIFLDFADLVKFAKYIPEADQPQADYDEAVSIIDSIRLAEMIKETPVISETAPVASGGRNV